MKSLLPLALGLAAALALARAPRADELELHFLDVGQGASTFVRGPDGTSVLIDGGNPGDGLAIVRPYLLSLGVTDLDYSVMTHWHSDHYGGFDEVFDAGMKPDVAAYDRGDFQKPSGAQVTQYLASVAGVRQTPPLGLVLPLGDGATLEVVALNGNTPAGFVPLGGIFEQFENGSSICVVIRYGDFACYVGGDVTAGGNGTADVEGFVAAYVGQVEVAQSSHHGSNTSSSPAVVAALAPSLVIHSAGDAPDLTFGHPTATTTDRWNAPLASRTVWCTSEGNPNSAARGFGVANGHVRVVTDGVRFTASRASGSERMTFATHENGGIPPLPGALAISEVLVDPAAAADARGEWFEITNVFGGGTVDLGGLRVTNGTQTFTLASRILLAYGERLVVGRDGRFSQNGGLFVGHGTPRDQFALANGGATLTLRNVASEIVDAVTWGPGGFAVQSGVAAERVDLLAPGAGAPFAPATSQFAGADLGTPWQWNDADATPWKAVLAVEPPPYVGGALTLVLSSYDEPGKLALLGLSQSFFPLTPAFGFQVPLALDALFLAFLQDPQAAGVLVGGERTVVLPLPANPALAGYTGFGAFVTVDLVGSDLVGSSLSNLVTFTVQP